MKRLGNESVMATVFVLICAACSGGVAASGTEQRPTGAVDQPSRIGDKAGSESAGASPSCDVSPDSGVPDAGVSDPGSLSDGGVDSADPDADIGVPPSDVVAYGSPTELEALLIGRWIRTAGPPQMNLETLGLELTATHEAYALQRAPNGDLQRVEPSGEGVERWSVVVFGGTIMVGFDESAGGSFLFRDTTFVDQGATMWFRPNNHWTTYSRLARDAGF